ncbi:hypothetical protein KI387_012064, partial [Taxus chinensis]
MTNDVTKPLDSLLDIHNNLPRSAIYSSAAMRASYNPSASKQVTGGLEFSDLTYTVLKKHKDVDGKWTTEEVDLLHKISGHAPKGSITAVMGPSGAGKSTFLDGLAGRIASGSLHGRVSMDGREINPTVLKKTSAYVMQDDRLFPMLTVYETLMYAAEFRLGERESYAGKQARVEKLIEQLGLTFVVYLEKDLVKDCMDDYLIIFCIFYELERLSPNKQACSVKSDHNARNTYIGNEEVRGVSGGERRRVSIGVDIIHGPAILFLDEPTSGLDSTSAHSVIEKVHDVAQGGSV